MKRIITLLTTVVLAVTMVMPALAADYHPSVEAESAPVIVPVEKEEETGKEIIGYIVYEDETVLSTEYEDCILVTAMADVADAELISDEAKKAMADFYTGILNGDISFADCPELAALVKEKLGEDVSADSLAVKDLFDVTVLCDVMNEKLPLDGTTIELTFDIDLPADAEIFVVTYKNGKVVLAEDAVNNGDGTVSATFADFCPVAFLVSEETSEVIGGGAECMICKGKFVYKPSPIPSVCMTCFTIIVAIIGAGVAGVYAYMKKKAKKAE